MRASTTSHDEIETRDDNVILDVSDRRFERIKIVVRSLNADALVLPSGCRNVTIDRLEIDTWTADGVKVQNAGAPASGVTVNGGYARGHASVPGVHQDGIQAMGGSNLVFRNMAWDFAGGGGGNVFVAQGGSGASVPTGVRFEHCAFGPSHPNQIRFNSGSGHALIGNLVYRPYSGRPAIAIGSGVTVEQASNSMRAPVPIDEAWTACLAYVGGVSLPPPSPSPAPPPPALDPCQMALERTIAELQTERSLRLAAELEAVRLAEALEKAVLSERELDELLIEAAARQIVP